MDDRKYRHRGYMDVGSQEDKGTQRPAPSGPRPKPEGPRGRGLGAPTDTVFRCRSCGTKQVLTGALGSEAVCGRCGAELHTCSNCVHFDTSKPQECRKPVLVRVAAKTRRNACETFTPNTVQEFASDKVAASADPRAAFDALFRKK